MAFSCDGCGLCCRHLKQVPQLAAFDRGDGVCVNLNEKGLCSVYDHRPEICNVDLMYEKYFHKFFTLEEYYKLNYAQCEKLKKENQ